MLPLPIRLALALDLLLIVLEHLFSSLDALLPLGGDHFIQLGAVVILGVVLTELSDITKAAISYLKLGFQWIVRVVRGPLPPASPPNV
ncbi:hypothetical protein PKCBPO_00007 [Methylorubrum thiocyanatum]